VASTVREGFLRRQAEVLTHCLLTVGSVERRGGNPFQAKWRRILRLPAVCCLFLLFAVASGWAVDPGRRISQYAHTSWRTQDGLFSGSPIVLAQTVDGYVWIGTNVGLVRFDGLRFVTWRPPTGQRLLDSRIASLRAAHDGSLWIGTGYSISRWKDGVLTNYPQLSGKIESIVEDADGAVWMVRTQATDENGPVCQIKNERIRCYSANDGIPFPLAVHLDRDKSGEFWISGYSQLSRWAPPSSKPGSATTYFTNTRHPATYASLKAIAIAGDGSVWAATEGRGAVLQLQHLENERWNTHTFPGIAVNSADVTCLFVDRNDALWVGTAHHGIFRARGSDTDHFGRTDGLSSDAVTRFYQDTEGTLWVVTPQGLDNFRDLKMASFSMREGLSAEGPSSVLVSRDDTVWIGNFQGLDFLRNDRLSAIRTGHGLPGRDVTTLFQDHAGTMWLGLDSGLWAYDGAVFREVRHTDGTALGVIFAITEDLHHDIWVRAGPHLDRIHNLKLEEELTSPQISTAYTLAANPQGGLVLGLVNGDLVQYDDGRTQTIPSGEAGNTRQIRDLLVESDGSVWGTTVDEVARWKNGTRKNLTTRNGLPCDGIFSLLKDRRESLWLYSRCGLVEIDKGELDFWWDHPDELVKFTLFDAFDGVQPGLTSLKPQSARSSDGRLWFVNGRILQVIDPNDLQKNSIPPPVHIEEVIANRKEYLPSGELALPALTRDLEIEYTALSFVVPQKVRFRYKLEGHDTTWQDPGTRREAFYSDLRPGPYRFRVMACNNDGVWNEEGAVLDFSVAPAWYQTNWFRFVCAVAAILVVWMIYRLRVRQVAKAIDARFNARLDERTRIARDLHDTFLQTIQGSKLVADVALRPSTDLEHMRQAMEQVSGWLEQATHEGRAALNSLRTSRQEKNDLAEALQRAMDECQMQSAIQASLSVVGDANEMHPIVQDEVYRIGYEAIRNACVHSKATKLRVELTYAHDLALLVSDNGVGIGSAIAKGGKEGHFGLQGMRERAARIAAKLTIASSAASGTEVKLVVPGSIVYRKPSSNGRGLSAKIKALLQRASLASRPD
jgi:signal transduction histidine kinase/ligand-binding sensor domain-containing protein